jgi:2-phosphosulfolactate phosphatase
VAVDVLRAGTTIVTALHHGAAGIIPCLDVDTARQRARSMDQALLGGERGGVLIDGFDLANAPGDYRPEVVANRKILFTTTNGTRAIAACGDAPELVIGSFVNLAAVCRHLIRAGRPVTIVCAGTDGEPTLEDALLGGAISHVLTQRQDGALNAAARAACQLWRTALRRIESGQSLSRILSQTQGGKNLLRLGRLVDIQFASQRDCFDLVPRRDPGSGEIRTDVDLAAAHR